MFFENIREILFAPWFLYIENLSLYIDAIKPLCKERGNKKVTRREWRRRQTSFEIKPSIRLLQPTLHSSPHFLIQPLATADSAFSFWRLKWTISLYFVFRFYCILLQSTKRRNKTVIIQYFYELLCVLLGSNSREVKR